MTLRWLLPVGSIGAVIAALCCIGVLTRFWSRHSFSAGARMNTAPACPPGRTDLVSDKRAYFLLWRMPWLAILASLPLKDSSLKAGIWTLAFSQMGIACIANASGCGRIHCYFTGPFYLLGALASFLRGTGQLPISWSGLLVFMSIGWLILGRVPERIWGKYTKRLKGARNPHYTTHAPPPFSIGRPIWRYAITALLT